MKIFVWIMITFWVLFILFPALLSILLGIFLLSIWIMWFMVIKGWWKTYGVKDEWDYVSVWKYKIYKNKK